jgi:hypothetical protein
MGRGGILLALAGCLVAAGTAAAECVDESEQMAAMERESVRLRHPRLGEVAVEVRVADDRGERAAGFQHICPDAVDRNAILFVFPVPVNARFHMRNVHASLDIAFIDQTGRVREVLRMEAEPPGADGPGRLYGPGFPFTFALETAAGYLTERGIGDGEWRLVR